MSMKEEKRKATGDYGRRMDEEAEEEESCIEDR